MTTLPSPERVLPTLNDDGTRRWIRPRLFRGRFYRARLGTAWALILLFVALPLLRVGGKPSVLLDVVHREFTLFGRTFLATDGVLLMLFLLSIFIAIFLVTALVGRAWCGWACPQTVYMEFLFRPLERLIEGDRRQQEKLDKRGVSGRRLLKHAVFLLVSVLVGNLFLSYFVGVSTLWHWVQRSPFEHPSAFGVMGVTALLVYGDFAYFREQMCTVACPYARLQSVLLDPRSLVVAYDEHRGEPRGKKGKAPGACVDCSLCVDVCPTGIDIRNGLQLECITCAQCIDACDSVMDKLHRPRGLIRYTSTQALATRSFRWKSLVRPRVLVYPAILALLLTALGFASASRSVAEVSVLRGVGAPFSITGGLVQNHVRIKVRNRTNAPVDYHFSVQGAPEARIVAPENPLRVAAGEQRTESVFVLSPPSTFRGGVRQVRIVVKGGADFERTTPYALLGPQSSVSAPEASAR